MTENQEKELFNILATLVTEVRTIKTDVQDIKVTQNEHSQILNEHSRILSDHSRILNRLDAKTDTIAETVMVNDQRLKVAEKNIEELQNRVH